MRRSFSNSSKTSSKSALLLGGCRSPRARRVRWLRQPRPGPGPSPPGGGGTEPACNASSSLEASADTSGDYLREPLQAPSPALLARKRSVTDGNPRGRLFDALWLHRSRAGRIRRPLAATGDRNAIDIGEIAVIRDEGDLIVPANTFDLRAIGLRFTRNGAGGYDVRADRRRLPHRHRQPDHARPTTTACARTCRSPFRFYGAARRTAFVNSDGNITFREGDNASTDRNVARLLTGPPRVAPFLADLDPSAGGRVLVNAASDGTPSPGATSAASTRRRRRTRRRRCCPTGRSR